MRQMPNPAHARQARDPWHGLWIRANDVGEVRVRIARLPARPFHRAQPLLLDRSDKLNEKMVLAFGHPLRLSISRMRLFLALLIDSRTRGVNFPIAGLNGVLGRDIFDRMLFCDPSKSRLVGFAEHKGVILLVG